MRQEVSHFLLTFFKNLNPFDVFFPLFSFHLGINGYSPLEIF